MTKDAEVRAAGGVVVRERDGIAEVALVHRPRYDDWSLPKGKLGKREDWSSAALREVEEETGLRCTLGPEVGSTRYEDPRGRAKHVRYWLMSPDGDGAFVPSDEVDEMRWVDRAAADALLSYDRDREILASALER